MIELATEGLEPSYFNKSKKSICHTNTLTTTNYILDIKREINPSYRIDLEALLKLSQFFGDKISFSKMLRKEIFTFLDSYRNANSIRCTNGLAQYT